MNSVLILISAMFLQGAEMVEQPSQRFTVEEWRKLSDREQSIAIIGGIEALLLATSGPDGDIIGIDANCLSNSNLENIKNKLKSNDVSEGSQFVLEVLEATQCYSQP